MFSVNRNPASHGSLISTRSQKDLENLKAEVQRRQQLQESGRSEEQPDGPLEMQDKLAVD